MNILMTGDLAYYVDAICIRAPSNHRLVLADADIPIQKKRGHISIFHICADDQAYSKLFRTFDFETAVFFMPQGDGQDHQSGSLECLKALLSLCTRYDTKRVILVSSTEVCGFPGAEETSPARPQSLSGIMLDTGERMCRMYGEQSGRESLILRTPYLYGVIDEDLFFGKLMLQAARHETVMLSGSPEQRCDFIHVEDIVSLLFRMVEDSADHDRRVIHACSGAAVEIADLALWIQKHFPFCDYVFSDDPNPVISPVNHLNARRQYDWLALHDLEQSIHEAAVSLSKNRASRHSRVFRLGAMLKRNSWLVQLAEILLGFCLMQFLLSTTADSYQFQFMDFRLLFVMLIGSMHGARAGVLAALLACFSNVLGYISLDLDWRALVYNVDNWLPYVSYLLVGAVTGYTRDKNDNAISYVEQKVSVLQSRYAFLHDLYHQTLQIKGQFKNQIVSCTTSYGKVYELTCRLDHLEADAVLMEAVPVLEEAFGNSSVAVYTLNATMSYARLEACSARLNNTLPRSIAATQYAQVYEKIQNNELWVNRDLLQDYPFYCMPLFSTDASTVMIMAFDVPYDLKSAGGANQFIILCKLIQSALARANAYQSAMKIQAGGADTHIIQRDQFHQMLDVRQEMRSRDIAGYALLRIMEPVNDLFLLCRKVERGIRRTDLIGQGKDGQIYILLVQAQMDSCKKVIDRLATMGVYSTPVEYSPDAWIVQKETSGVA